MADGPYDVPEIAGTYEQEREYYIRRILERFPSRSTDPALLYGDPKLEFLRLVNEGLIPDGKGVDSAEVTKIVTEALPPAIIESKKPKVLTGNAVNLNDLKGTNDLIHIRGNAQIVDMVAQNFPVKGAGMCNTISDNGMTYQTYQAYSDVNRIFWRGYYSWNDLWTEWQEFASGKVGKGRISFGGSLGKFPDSFSAGANATIVALGKNAMGEMEQVAQSIAIGSTALGKTKISRDNIAIGDSSLRNIQSLSPWYDQDKMEGTRNIAIGGNSSYFNTRGIANTVIGRNAGQCQEGGRGAVIIGTASAAGTAPIGLDGEIMNGSPWGAGITPVDVTLIGASTGTEMTSTHITAIGSSALMRNKKSRYNTALGGNALEVLDVNTGPNGGTYTELGTLTGTYSHSGNTVTVNINAHTLAVGDLARIRLLDGDSMTFQGDKIPVPVVKVNNANSFTFTHPESRTASGTAALYAKETAALMETNDHNTALGAFALMNMTTGGWNTVGGSNALFGSTRSTLSTVFGYNSGKNAVAASRATILGSNAAVNAVNQITSSTAIGANALSLNIDGTPQINNYLNSTGIGYDSRVSGVNQVALGNSDTTTYVYGTVQNRSDRRDKTDIRDTELGLDFINKLRPVDFKWDMREDYYVEDEDGNKTPIEKDGSKKRNRYHHGVIAQELKEVIEESGAEFGGFQDHAIAGGSDVMSVGYDEFIAPLIKAVQELSARVKELENEKK